MTKRQWIIGVILAMVAALAILCGKLGVWGKSPETSKETVEAKGPARSAFSDGKSGGAKTGKPAQRKSAAKRISRAPSDPCVTDLERARRETNAAEIYKMTFALMKSETTKGKIERINELTGFGTSGKDVGDLTDEEKAELGALFRSPELREIFDLLKEASGKDTCDFELDYSQGYSLPLPHLAPTRELIRLVDGAARFFAVTGDISEAIAFTNLGFQTANGLNGENTLISQLVFFACDKIMMSSLNAISDASLPEDQANAIARELAKRDYAAGVEAALKREALFAYDTIDKLATGEITLDELPGDRQDAASDDNLRKLLEDKELVAENKRKIKEYFENIASLLSRPYDKATRDEVERLATELRSLPAEKYELVSLVAPVMGAMVNKVFVAGANRDAALLSLAYSIYESRYGKAPDSPADLKGIQDAFKR